MCFPGSADQYGSAGQYGYSDSYGNHHQEVSGPPNPNYPPAPQQTSTRMTSSYQEVSGPPAYPLEQTSTRTTTPRCPITTRVSSGHTAIKFRLKGSTHGGISVNQAIERVRLSQGTANLRLHDISMDMSGKMELKVRVRFISAIVFVVPFDSCDFVLRDQWSGYRSNMYSIPLSTDDHSYVNLQSLARRTARAIVHFMEVNALLQLSQPWAHSLFADKLHRSFL